MGLCGSAKAGGKIVVGKCGVTSTIGKQFELGRRLLNCFSPNPFKRHLHALAITYSYESEVDIELRQKLSEQARIKQREQVRERSQVQI